jgi:hypothetical protein
VPNDATRQDAPFSQTHYVPDRPTLSRLPPCAHPADLEPDVSHDSDEAPVVALIRCHEGGRRHGESYRFVAAKPETRVPGDQAANLRDRRSQDAESTTRPVPGCIAMKRLVSVMASGEYRGVDPDALNETLPGKRATHDDGLI